MCVCTSKTIPYLTAAMACNIFVNFHHSWIIRKRVPECAHNTQRYEWITLRCYLPHSGDGMSRKPPLTNNARKVATMCADVYARGNIIIHLTAAMAWPISWNTPLANNARKYGSSCCCGTFTPGTCMTCAGKHMRV